VVTKIESAMKISKAQSETERTLHEARRRLNSRRGLDE